MKVGIASCYYHHNYGSMLQAYATQKIIQNLGHEVVTIQCNAPVTYMQQSKITYLFHKITNPDILRRKIREYSSKQRLNRYPQIKNNIELRNQKFEEFFHKHIRLSKLCRNRSELESLAGTLDAVVVGSDMLWHPVNVEHDYFTLTFVPDNVKKISYATSFGTTEIPRYQREKYRKYLSRFSAVSVREQSGISVIERLDVKKDVHVVLDPTLLFTGKEWLNIQDEEPLIKEKYIFCYFLGVNQEHRRFARQLKEITGYKIAALQHLDEFVKDDIGFADDSLYDAGPSEFINLIRNAEYVCTDSFHGTCFSILNHKKFFTFNRFKNTNSQSTNTRIDSLLAMTGLEERRVDAGMSPEDMEKYAKVNIEYDMVDNRLLDERKKSIAFLRKALEA